jgi:hypothetical protein
MKPGRQSPVSSKSRWLSPMEQEVEVTAVSKSIEELKSQLMAIFCGGGGRRCDTGGASSRSGLASQMVLLGVASPGWSNLGWWKPSSVQAQQRQQYGFKAEWEDRNWTARQRSKPHRWTLARGQGMRSSGGKLMVQQAGGQTTRSNPASKASK